VVTTDFSGMPYVVGEAGLKVEPGDPHQLYRALLEILQDNEKAGELARKGRNRVLEKFTPQKVGEKILDGYKKIVD